MKLVLLFLIAPFVLFAQSYTLPQLIEHANKHNKQIKAKMLAAKSAKSKEEAQSREFWPTFDVGASYSYVTPTTLVTPGQTGSVYASLQVDLYDGGRKSALLRSTSHIYKASLLEKRAFEKSVTLQIVSNYYTVLKLRSILTAMHAQTKEIAVQIDRMEKFKGAGLSTQEDIDKLQAEYENNKYIIENTKFNLINAQENLSLVSGIPVKDLAKNRFLEPKGVAFEAYEKSKILKANVKALDESAKAIDAGYMPQVKLADTYSQTGYSDVGTIPGFPSGSGDGFLPEEQNKLMLSVNLRLFDHGKMKKDREAVMYKKLATNEEQLYALEEQRMQFKLAKSRMQTLRAKGQSAKSALRAASSTYSVILKKYEVGLVDNITYLDALNNKTLSSARYKEALYDYEVSKSIFYYFSGKNIKEYIR